MNTTTQTDTTPGELPDYKIAAQELAAYFATPGLRAEITGAHAAIDEAEGHDGKGWAHVGVTVTFTRPGGDNGPGTPRRAGVSFATPYKMGTGLADWARILKQTHVSRDEYPLIKAMARQGGSLSPAGQANLCAKYLSAFVAKVNPAEVLASLCRDGQDACGQSFEAWASDYGYDIDSRKAEGIYHACQRAGDGARKLLSHAPGAVAKLAELSSRL